MDTIISPLAALLFLLLLSIVPPPAIANSPLDRLVGCLQNSGISNFTTSQHFPHLHQHLLSLSLHNMRYASLSEPTRAPPPILVVPQSAPQVQNALLCSLRENFHLCLRSGGHSFEALSSRADYGPNTVILDFMDMQFVEVDLHSRTAWVGPGATLGQIAYAISQKTSNYGLSAGICPTVGSGGHFSGGGHGFLSRKFGLASDNVIDAKLVDANGNLLDRQGMGEDLFWALRGGGGGSWGAVVAWKIKLVPVPARMTVFNVTKVDREQIKDLIYKWQTIAPFASDELFIAVRIRSTGALFFGQYLGPIGETVALFNNVFPELELGTADCKEVSWIEAVLSVANLVEVTQNTELSSLTDRFGEQKFSFKGKTDFVTSFIAKDAWEGALQFLEQNPYSYILLNPYGGILARIPADATPFPHREGSLYSIEYFAAWFGGGEDEDSIQWMSRFYDYMTPYVSKSPRRANGNAVDLDLGFNPLDGRVTLEEAQSWGERFFGGNFPKLLEVKRKMDPHNIFKHPQSIPLITNLGDHQNEL